MANFSEPSTWIPTLIAGGSGGGEPEYAVREAICLRSSPYQAYCSGHIALKSKGTLRSDRLSITGLPAIVSTKLHHGSVEFSKWSGLATPITMLSGLARAGTRTIDLLYVPAGGAMSELRLEDIDNTFEIYFSMNYFTEAGGGALDTP